VQRWPPSDFEPTWQPTTTWDYDQLGRVVARTTASGPNDEPEVLTWSYGPDGRVTGATRRGGSTGPLTGAVLSTAAEPAVGPNLWAGDPDDPLPMPACAPQPVPQSPDAADPGTGATQALDPRSVGLRRLGAAELTPVESARDPFGRLTTFLAGGSDDTRPLELRTWRVQYDQEDRIRRIEIPPSTSGGVPQRLEWRYDEVGNVVEMGEGGQVSQYAYDERNALIEARWASGVTARYTYDDRGDLAQAWLLSDDGQPEHVVDYAHDGLHRPRQVTRFVSWPDLSGAEVTAYAYDDAGRCTAYRVG
jgi:YD repeat-containing protein